MLPHPAAPALSGIAGACPNQSATGRNVPNRWTLTSTIATGCWYGGGVDRRHAAMARCLADVIQTDSGTKVYIEQTIP